MQTKLFRTSLIAAFFYAGILAGCSEDTSTSAATEDAVARDVVETEPAPPRINYTRCDIQTTPIASVQGSDKASPMLDQQVTVQGVVTLVQPGQGLFVEEPYSDDDAATSNAIFLALAELPADIGSGAWISAQGTVTELSRGKNSLTALTEVTTVASCSTGQPLPATNITLPLRVAEREALEGMRIHLGTELTVTDTYQLKQGRVSLAGNGFQFVATEIMAPGPDAHEQNQQNRRFTLHVSLPADRQQAELLITGSTIDGMTGVMAHDDRRLRVALQSINANETPGFMAPDRAGKGELRVVGMNLLNYFNGDGKGGGFPTERGAKKPAAFERQRQRLAAAIRVLDPHVLAVMELENDGFGPLSAAADFIELLQDATGALWRVVKPAGNDTGKDKITVGIFYRDDMIETSGEAEILQGPEFKRSRQPLAQVFTLPDGDEKILIVVNHLKSKGSCPENGPDANQNDGQGCWNPIRVASAEKMSAWVSSLAESSQTSNALILGDMNAYRLEDPINTIRTAGFIELLDETDSATGERTYSYVYRGQAGTLDYAFVTTELQPKVQRAFIWHANAAFPTKMEMPQPWLRFSDHDPVVVDIRLHQSITSD